MSGLAKFSDEDSLHQIVMWRIYLCSLVGCGVTDLGHKTL